MFILFLNIAKQVDIAPIIFIFYYLWNRYRYSSGNNDISARNGNQ